MPKVQWEMPLTDWKGDTPSLIAELKRRAGVTTDLQLARYLGVAQATISHWRARNRIPEAALLRAEGRLALGGESVAGRMLAARMIALRLPEFWLQRAGDRGAKAGRAIFYRSVALAWPELVNEITEQLSIFERETGQAPLDLAPQLLDDSQFLERLVEHAITISAADR